MSWDVNENERGRRLSEERDTQESEDTIPRTPLLRVGKVNIDPLGIFQRTDINPRIKGPYLLSIAAWQLFKDL